MKYPYITLLCTSFLIGVLFWIWFPEIGQENLKAVAEERSVYEKMMPPSPFFEEVKASGGGKKKKEKKDTKEILEEDMEEVVQEESNPTQEKAEEYMEPENFFDDTLLIGDSRMVGLFEYAEMENAEMFAATGMSIYKVLSAELPVDGEKKNLEKVLTEKTYKKIYLMLGLNELGYDLQQTVNKYEEVLQFIEGLQPETKLILLANMHVTEEKSLTDPVINNERINQLNKEIEELSKTGNRRYQDINQKFDDENGNLEGERSNDGVHIKAEGYEEEKEELIRGWKDF